MQSKLYDLLDVLQADAGTLYQTLVNAIESDKISVKNVIGFAADTCNVMLCLESITALCLALKKRYQIFLLCDAFATVLIFARRMHVKNFPGQLGS